MEQTCDEFAQLFCAQVEMIAAHGGMSGLHHGMALEHQTLLAVEEGIALDLLSTEDRKLLYKCVCMLASKEYLACMMGRIPDNNRFKALKQL